MLYQMMSETTGDGSVTVDQDKSVTTPLSTVEKEEKEQERDDDAVARSAIRNLHHNTQQLTDAYNSTSKKLDLQRKHASDLGALLEEARAMISKREGQVITAKQKALAANEQVQRLTDERDQERAEASRKAEEIEALRAEIEGLTTENREFKKVSRVVALENQNSRLAEENERLSKALFTKAQKQQQQHAPART